MNAGNILAMTKDVLDTHNGQVPANWEFIKAFHGVGPKIAFLLLPMRLLVFTISLLIFMCSGFPSSLGGALAHHQLSNAKKILKVGCPIITGILSIAHHQQL
jgi:hypothetical protein